MLGALRLVRDLRFLRKAHGVPIHEAIPDFLALRRRIRINRQDFLQFGLYDRRVPWRDRLTYLSTPDRIRIEYLMNPRAPSRRLLDKLAVTELLDAAGIPTLETCAAWVPAGARAAWSGLRLHEEAGLREFLRAHEGAHGLVFKPNGGYEGLDVLVFNEVSTVGVRQLSGEWWSISDLVRRLDTPPRTASNDGLDPTWKVERRAEQHPQIESAVGPTLATVRVVVYRPRDGRPRILPPTWKVPVDARGTDNLAFGGWMAGVEEESGRVGPLIQKITRATRSDHPTTGIRIEGMVLPEWGGILDVAIRATACFPELRSLGCDVAMTRHGPRLVEVNPFWGSQMIQIPRPVGVVQGDFAAFLGEIGAGWVTGGRSP